MNYNIDFAVSYTGKDGFTGDARITSPELFQLLRIRYPDNSINPKWFILRTRFDDAKDSNLFKTIEMDGGKSPVADLEFACDHPDKYYPVKVERIATAEELNQSPWLMLLPGDRELSGRGTIESDGTYVVPKAIKTKEAVYGSNGPAPWMHLFSPTLKDQLIQSGLRIEFRPVKQENGKPSGLWQLQTLLEMPPLAMTLLNSRYQPFDGDQSKGCMISEGSYYPWVLKYRQSDVEKLADFDVAFTKERFGFPHQAHPKILISQRFRQVAEKLAPGQFNYGLVAVGEGEELQTRYTIPELAPPRDAV